MRADFYVYALLRADGLTPFYIGKGYGPRVKMHATAGELRRDSHKSRIARKVISEIGHLPHEIVASCLTEADAFEVERGLITLLGRATSGGYLANATDGGDGTAGLVRSEQDRGRKASAAISLWSDQAFRKKVAEGFSRPGVRENLSRASKDKWADPEYRARLGAIHRKRMADPEERRRRSEATRLGIARARAERAASGAS